MASTTSPARPRTRDLLTRRRVLSSLALALAAFFIVAGFQGHHEKASTLPRNPAVRAVYPREGTLELRQTDVFYELSSGFTGVLEIDGHEIPDDQVLRINGLNRISFTPGPDRDFTSFSPGLHHAQAVFWTLGSTREQGSQSYSWSFALH